MCVLKMDVGDTELCSCVRASCIYAHACACLSEDLKFSSFLSLIHLV